MDEEELSSEKCRKMSSECLISEKKEENELVFSELRIRGIDLGKKLINAEATKLEEKSSVRYDEEKSRV